jgi:hypothetical protein
MPASDEPTSVRANAPSANSNSRNRTKAAIDLGNSKEKNVVSNVTNLTPGHMALYLQKHPQRLNFEKRVRKVEGVLFDGMENLTVARQEMVTTLMAVAGIEDDFAREILQDNGWQLEPSVT